MHFRGERWSWKRYRRPPSAASYDGAPRVLARSDKFDGARSRLYRSQILQKICVGKLSPRSTKCISIFCLNIAEIFAKSC